MCFRLCFKCSAQGCCSCGGELTTDAPLTAARADVYPLCPSRRLGQPLLWDCITHRSEPYRHRPALLFRQQKREVVFFSCFFFFSHSLRRERSHTTAYFFRLVIPGTDNRRLPTALRPSPLLEQRGNTNQNQPVANERKQQGTGKSRQLSFSALFIRFRPTVLRFQFLFLWRC